LKEREITWAQKEQQHEICAVICFSNATFSLHGLRKVTAEQTLAAAHSTLTIGRSRSYHNTAHSLKLSYTEFGCRKNHCALLRFE